MGNSQSSNPAPPPPPPPRTGPRPQGATPRVRPMTAANGARIPYDRRELQTFLTTTVVRDRIFQHSDYTDALNLTEAFNIRGPDGLPLRDQDFIMCQGLTCQDAQVFIFPPRLRPHDPFTLQPPPWRAANPTNRPCTDSALWTNPISTVPGFGAGAVGISKCLETFPFYHLNQPHLVCTTCKTNRGADHRWRREARAFGVCNACRTWASANLPNNVPNHKDWCACMPSGPRNWTNGLNGNGAREDHLCYNHDAAFDVDSNIHMRQEIDRRLRMRRRKGQKRKPGTKSRAKRWDLCSPLERRARMKWVGGKVKAVPTCYCGGPMTAVQHARPLGFAAAGPAGVDWRSCTGCNEFVKMDC